MGRPLFLLTFNFPSTGKVPEADGSSETGLIFPPALTGADKGINPERALKPRRMQFNEEVFWLTSP